MNRIETLNNKSVVRATHCDYRADDEEVYQSLKRATDPLTGAWEKLSSARRIGIKFNQDNRPERVVMYEGHRQQLVSDTVVRALVRLLRERTTAELFTIDVGVERPQDEEIAEPSLLIKDILDEYGVERIAGQAKPAVWVDVPGGGAMFDRYPVPQDFLEADAMISVQKLKSHAFMGVTLCLKNLFGLVPLQPTGRPRGYYHHLVRMPYMLTDLGKIFNPVLNIIDGLVGQAGQEWGKGEHPRVCNTLVAGDQVIATDACGAALMGHDPSADWLTPPFHRDRNALLVAEEHGFGTVYMDKIDFQSEVPIPVSQYFTQEFDDRERVITWRRTMAEQGLYYRDHMSRYTKRHPGEYILLQMGRVRWHEQEGNIYASRRKLAGKHPDQAMWLKYVDPDEMEKEHFEVYEQALAQMDAMGV
jgi:uncharacterized protein (DUF362 family)